VIAVTAEGRIPALTSSEDIFSLAVPFVAWSENRIGANAPEGKKTHQGIFSKNRTIAVSATRAKWSGTHQDSETWGGKTVLEIAIDANGNTLSDPSGKSYTWDFENRLTQAVVPGTNGGTTTFKYDPFGRRIQKSGPLGTTNYLYDRKNILETTDQTGNELAHYADTLNVDEILSEFISGTTSFYERDGLGSVTSLSGSSGALANTYTYDSFGKLTASTGTLTSPFQYTGREFDSETGVYYYRARYYDSAVGRFLSEDPIRFAGGGDFYRYAFNDPTAFRDPLGLCPLSGSPKDLIEKANDAFVQCVSEHSLPAVGVGVAETVSDASKDKEGPTTTGVIVNVANAALDLQKDCLGENPLADLSPNYRGVFNSGDPGVNPVFVFLGLSW
jgi:RHS repeat-associated protein